jgi:hypothetical protein
MTTKDIRKAIKAGKKVTFNRHVWGAPHGYDRLPVLSVKDIHGKTWVKFFATFRGVRKAVWGGVNPDLDDYVSIDFPPAAPVSWG